MEKIPTTHVGSLIRPSELLPFLTAIERNDPYDVSVYEESLARAVADSVRAQADAGIDIVNDGEMGKTSWITYLYGRVSGIEPRMVPLQGTNALPPTRDREAFAEFYAGHDVALRSEAFDQTTDKEKAGAGFGGAADAKAPSAETDPGMGKLWACTGPITYDPTAVQRDISHLKAALEGVEVADAFLTAVSPASIYWLQNEYYPTEEEFVFAVADALHEEYKAITDAGLILQVDDAVLMHKYETILMLGGSLADYREWAEVRVEALNHALAGVPEDRVRYHLCCGSCLDAHTFDTPLSTVVDLVLKVRARGYLIEQANARHEHEWQLWEDVKLPADKVLIPGFVTHKTPVVEHPELVAQRIERMVKVVGPDRLVASTDCGFAQGAFTRRVPLYTQWAKLEALVEGAALATDRLARSGAIA